MNETLQIPTCVPTKSFKRNEYGLICDESVVYVYNPDGTINWRKMIKPEFLVPHKQYFERNGLPVPETTTGLDDKLILILLGGIKDLAKTRGYLSVEYKISSPSREYFSAVCSISWVGNYETNDIPITFSAIGDAHEGNTNGFAKNFLGPIAENRAFCRAVRNFLNINIVSQDELGGQSESAVVEDVGTGLLKETMAKYSLTFEKVKAKLVEEKVENAESFNRIEDIPRFKQFELIERIKAKAAQRGVQA